MNTEWQKYISIELEIHHCEPCISGTHAPVSTIMESVASGMTIEEILSEMRR